MPPIPPQAGAGGPDMGIRALLEQAVAQQQQGGAAAAAPQGQGPVTRDAFGYEDKASKPDSNCGNCQFFDGQSTCGLYAECDKKMPKVFSLDPATTPGSWCQAHTDVDGGDDEEHEEQPAGGQPAASTPAPPAPAKQGY